MGSPGRRLAALLALVLLALPVLLRSAPDGERAPASRPAPARTRTRDEPAAVARALRITVQDEANGAPLPAATVRVFRGRDLVASGGTDDAGEAAPEGLLPGVAYHVEAFAPGVVPPRATETPTRPRTRVAPDQDTVLLQVPVARVIAWEVRDGDIPVPPDGTAVPLFRSAVVAPPAAGLMRDGKLWTSGWGPGAAHALAHGPDDTRAILYAAPGADHGRPFAFRRTTSFTLEVRTHDGAPVPRRAVTLLGPGNQPLAESVSGADGRARFTGLFGTRASVYLAHDFVGTIALDEGRDVRATYVFSRPRAVAFRILAEGEAGLPDDLTVTFPSGFGLRDRHDDPATRTVRGVLMPPRGSPGSAVVRVGAPGFVAAEAEIALDADPIRHTFRLRRGLSLRVVRRGPRRASLAVRRNAEFFRPVPGDGVLAGLEPGRFTVVAAGVRLAEVELREGEPEPEVVVDGDALADVRGRVTVPEGHRLREARVAISGAGIEPSIARGRVDPRDGSFRVWIPTDRDVTIRPVHPRLAARAAVTTRTGHDDLVLELVEGPALRFRLPEYFTKRSGRWRADDPGWRRPEVRVLFFRGAVAGAPAHGRIAVAELTEWVVPDPPRGRWTVWVDVPEGTPVVRRGVTVGAAGADLGALPVRDGSTLAVHVLVAPPFHAPRISVHAERRGLPAVSRSRSSRGEAVVRVPGLPAGRYEVRIGTYTRSLQGHRFQDTHVVDVDGTQDAELVYDLR